MCKESYKSKRRAGWPNGKALLSGHTDWQRLRVRVPFWSFFCCFQWYPHCFTIFRESYKLESKGEMRSDAGRCREILQHTQSLRALGIDTIDS